jgi:hypothetical protein
MLGIGSVDTDTDGDVDEDGFTVSESEWVERKNRCAQPQMCCHHQIWEVVIWADQGSSLVSYRCLGYHLISGDRSDGQYSIYV